MAGNPDDLLTITDVITILRVSRSAFWRWRRRGTGPPVARLPGGAVRIRRADLAAWLAGRQPHDQEQDTAA